MLNARTIDDEREPDSLERDETGGGKEAVSAIGIEVCRGVTDELCEAMARMVPLVSSSAPIPTENELRQIVSTDSTCLLVARDGNRIVGTLTLVIFRIPTGVRAWIEDVAVDASARGRGIGETLSREALRIAASHGARTVDLTSRPSREAANRLYRRIGFETRDTNVYRYIIADSSATPPSADVEPQKARS
jgi:ribosomal protein S18 acetylase RimI-like enzyme